ncbi:MAG: helix-hairpin-helix domain-containing protein [Anaerolineales bacterium]|nr:helix-hairpin-helix domain-containing protein [Anaerolineales bacterium]
MKNALYALVGVMSGFALAGILVLLLRLPTGKPIALLPAPTKAPITVHVVGAVPRPGLYRLAEGARVQDAIDAAGGFLVSADENAINLAALVEDGQQLKVPYRVGQEAASASANDEDNSLNLPGSENPNGGGGLIDINSATSEELQKLPGIGPTIAQRIIDYRAENGPFDTIEEIMDVSGIGPATFAQIEDLITAQ